MPKNQIPGPFPSYAGSGRRSVRAETPIIVAAGPRDAEARLLHFIGEHLSGGFDGLDRPIRIVVPSRSLRNHVLRVLAQYFGSVVGVLVQTQRGLALEVLERAGLGAPPGGARIQDLIVRRLAAHEDILRNDLGGYDDGAALAAAAVRDLIDAGFKPEHLAPVTEAVAGARLKEGERAKALLRVAAGCQAVLHDNSWAHRGTAYTLANEVLLAKGRAVLPSRAIVIYGFAETTGLLADLFETLVESLGAKAVIDRPPDPAHSDRCDGGWVFTSRLVDRLSGPGSSEKLEWVASARSRENVGAFTAPGPEAEVREIASRIRMAAQGGAEWEDIAVVFRRLDSPIVAAVRRHFTRLGIPFSGEGASVPGGRQARRAAALAELLSSGSAARTEAWLACLTWEDQASRYEVDLALRAAGAARLEDVGRLDDPTGDVTLPIVERLEEADGDLRRRNRVLPAEGFGEAVRRARLLVAVLESRPDEASVRELLGWVRKVLEVLEWESGVDIDPVSQIVEGLENELPHDLQVEWRELSPILANEIERIDLQALGGAGGGVQVLSVMEARGRTFGHLFLGGLNRGVFPARPVEDPVLSTAARRAIPGDVLPDMPLKSRDTEEERYLFAQLMAAAPSVTLSWRRVDSEGKESNPSVFLERLRFGEVVWWQRGEGGPPASGCAEAREALDLFGDRGSGEAQPAMEHAVAAGLGGRTRVFHPALTELSPVRAGHLCAALDELDPSIPRHDLGPFLGVVGLRPPAATPVTRLEQMAACPWQTFLERELGLVPPPEASFAEIGLSGRVAGMIVHEVLETVATMQGVPAGHTLDTVRNGSGVEVCRPEAAELDLLVGRVAARVAERDGVPSLAPAIAAYVRAVLERAADVVWPDGGPKSLGVETRGGLRLPWTDQVGGRHELDLRFRADMVGRDDEGGGLVLVDYKTGAVDGLSPKTGLPRGRFLQGAVYTLAAGEGSIGRYISVADPEKNVKRGVDIDFTLAGQLEACADIILGCWQEGVLFPRVSTPSGNAQGGACGWCRVKTACLLGETGVKGRLVNAFGSMDADSALHRMWNLPMRKSEVKP